MCCFFKHYCSSYLYAYPIFCVIKFVLQKGDINVFSNSQGIHIDSQVLHQINFVLGEFYAIELTQGVSS